MGICQIVLLQIWFVIDIYSVMNENQFYVDWFVSVLWLVHPAIFDNSIYILAYTPDSSDWTPDGTPWIGVPIDIVQLDPGHRETLGSATTPSGSQDWFDTRWHSIGQGRNARYYKVFGRCLPL